MSLKYWRTFNPYKTLSVSGYTVFSCFYPKLKFRSCDYPGKICDQQEMLQQWLLTLPTTLLEDVIEKVMLIHRYDITSEE